MIVTLRMLATSETTATPTLPVRGTRRQGAIAQLLVEHLATDRGVFQIVDRDVFPFHVVAQADIRLPGGRFNRSVPGLAPRVAGVRPQESEVPSWLGCIVWQSAG